MYGVVAVGLLAGLRNPTAMALSVAWIASEIVYLDTGNNLSLSTHFMADIAVIALIYAKTILRMGPKLYPTLGRQIYCMFLDLTKCDRWIVAIYLLGAWPLYVLSLDSYYRWWGLYWLVIAQFLLASAEAAQSYVAHLRSRAAPDPPGNGLALAGAFRRDG